MQIDLNDEERQVIAERLNAPINIAPMHMPAYFQTVQNIMSKFNPKPEAQPQPKKKGE